MRKAIYLIFLLLFVGTSALVTYNNRDKYASLFNSMHPCDSPITYRIDTVDKRFNLTRDQFRADVNDAANLWNLQRPKALFVYDPNGKISVSMVYDQRQQESTAINSLDSKLETDKGKLDSQVAAYRQEVADFKNRLSDHNSRVQSWNAQGGAPPDEFEKLNQEQRNLQNEADNLNKAAKNLNLSSENFNAQVGNLNSAIENFNADLSKKPEEGIFKGDTSQIEIYFNNNKQELVHTLAHELGHSVNLEHNDNSKSIMYPYTSKVVALSADDKTSLDDVCRSRSFLDVISSRLDR